MGKRALAAAAFLLLFTALAIAGGGVTWLPLKEGMHRAKTEKKPMIIDFFYGKGCPRCERLEQDVYGDPKIAAKIMADFVPILVDLTKPLSPEEEALGNKFDFKQDCLLLFLDHTGEVITDPSGKKLCFVENLDPEWFVGYLDMIKARGSR